MGRLYSVPFTGVADANAIDFFELLTPSDAIIVIHHVILGQTTEVSDTAEEQLEVLMRRVTGAPTSGSGGSTPTPTPVEVGDAASVVTAEAGNTTALTGGTSLEIARLPWNIRGPFEWLPTPEERPTIGISTRFVCGQAATPADSITYHGTCWFEEIGS